ncbi:flavin reductase [uncultured Sphaerochaeta sp.]|uniref:flavin reductase n=1 Tax=uncultured Sphaerochaeta sp. TaxID=886478 RepID=UPI002A0A8E62|nr:flavin reductase [uncultured Sphaerochaeta sp.]
MFTEVSAELLEMNPFSAIGSDGFLLTAGTTDKFNTMTASWGTMGVLWGRNVLIAFVRRSRYTHQFMETSKGFTCSFFGPEMKEALLWCGQHSGRETDKVVESGLKAVPIPSPDEVDRVSFKQAKLVFSCTKASVMEIDETQFFLPEIQRHYRDGDYHTAYIGFIDTILVNQ